MKPALFVIIACVLFAHVAEAQDFQARRPPFLRCIPLNIDRPFQVTDGSTTTTETIITMGSPSDPYYFVRYDIRSSNVWKTADNVVYQYSSIDITDETVITIGSPGDPLYTVRYDSATTTRYHEQIIFPNRTYVVAGSTSFMTNGVLADNSFKATKYCYGTRIGTPLTKAQYDRLKKWLGI